MTALAATNADKRIKCTLTLDPWIRAFKDDVLAGKWSFDGPMIFCHSQNFQVSQVSSFEWLKGQDIPATIEAYFNACKNSKKEMYEFEGTNHLTQCDYPLVNYLLAQVIMYSQKARMTTTGLEDYITFSNHLLKFAAEAGFAPEEDFDVKAVTWRVEREIKKGRIVKQR